MGGIKLQLLCGVRIELAVGSLPNLARIPSRSLPLPLGGTQSTFLGRRGATNMPTLGLEVESLHRDNPSLVLSIWGLNKQTNKQTKKQRNKQTILRDLTMWQLKCNHSKWRRTEKENASLLWTFERYVYFYGS